MSAFPRPRTTSAGPPAEPFPVRGPRRRAVCGAASRTPRSPPPTLTAPPPPTAPPDPRPQKRQRTARTPAGPAAPAAGPAPRRDLPPCETEVLEGLAALEGRVEEFLHGLQAQLRQAGAQMLEAVMAHHLAEAAAVRGRVPEVQDVTVANEKMAGYIEAMRSLR